MNTMWKITLIIEAAGVRPQTKIEVEASTSVGTCVASLVEQFGYPKVDATGRPMTYHLRPVGSQQPLANTAPLSERRIHSEMHVVLEAEGTSTVTIPLCTPLTLPIPRARRWNRRSFITLTLVGCSVAGLGMGAVAAFAQRSLRGTGTSITPTPRPATIPQGVTLQHTFAGHQQHTVRVVGWSPDGTLLASGGDDAQVLIWRPTGSIQQRIAHPAPVQALAWSPESLRVMTGAGTQVAFFQALTGTRLARSTQRHTSLITSVAWTPNKQMQAVSGGSDHHVVVWETTTYQAQTVFVRHTAPIEAVSWAADGQVVASASQGGVIRVWDAENAQEIHGFYQDAQIPMQACAFAPTGSSLAVGGHDGVVRLWNGFVCQHALPGNDGLTCQDTPLRLTSTTNTPIRALAWSRDARYLAAGTDNGTLTVWNPLKSQAPLFTATVAEGHTIHSLSWSADNQRLAIAAGTTVGIWSLLT
ncbi:hypothetical protein KSF_109610 [Reticulibacter mediterranei]|uniref:Anaphase-promoting complex subunit 4 WD40 domain-containing protein n=1 Tax=Reticulibacter mediterranei TaxID=2778369 RepID=A0A8J3N9L0_9CHLR|nr:WD40 repeat domain-containing protein [Reticulibacter mediterranei]GHP00914.1 hypothetical protein KSF_109610 [Reticulibacter mediterranei]